MPRHKVLILTLLQHFSDPVPESNHIPKLVIPFFCISKFNILSEGDQLMPKCTIQSSTSHEIRGWKRSRTFPFHSQISSAILKPLAVFRQILRFYLWYNQYWDSRNQSSWGKFPRILKRNMIVYFSQKTPSVYAPKTPFAVLHNSKVLLLAKL